MSFPFEYDHGTPLAFGGAHDERVAGKRGAGVERRPHRVAREQTERLACLDDEHVAVLA